MKKVKRLSLLPTIRVLDVYKRQDPMTARNKNVLVIGGSGSGKTRFWLKPNLMQMHSSYAVSYTHLDVYQSQILLTMVDSRTNFAKEISALLRETYGSKIKVVGTEIPHSVRAKEISAEGKSIFAHDPGGKVAELSLIHILRDTISSFVYSFLFAILISFLTDLKNFLHTNYIITQSQRFCKYIN